MSVTVANALGIDCQRSQHRFVPIQLVINGSGPMGTIEFGDVFVARCNDGYASFKATYGNSTLEEVVIRDHDAVGRLHQAGELAFWNESVVHRPPGNVWPTPTVYLERARTGGSLRNRAKGGQRASVLEPP
jgi:hypothetical protein